MQDVDNDAASTPMNDVKDAKQTHAHHEEDIWNDGGEDVIQDPHYTPTCDKSSVSENEDSLTMVAATLEQEHED